MTTSTLTRNDRGVDLETSVESGNELLVENKNISLGIDLLVLMMGKNGFKLKPKIILYTIDSMKKSYPCMFTKGISGHGDGISSLLVGGRLLELKKEGIIEIRNNRIYQGKNFNVDDMNYLWPKELNKFENESPENWKERIYILKRGIRTVSFL